MMALPLFLTLISLKIHRSDLACVIFIEGLFSPQRIQIKMLFTTVVVVEIRIVELIIIWVTPLKQDLLTYGNTSR